MMQLTQDGWDYLEVESLNRPQIATGSQRSHDPRCPPDAPTEHGAKMNSPEPKKYSIGFVELQKRKKA